MFQKKKTIQSTTNTKPLKIDIDKSLNELTQEELAALSGTDYQPLANVLLTRISVTNMASKDTKEASCEKIKESRALAKAMLGGLNPQNTVQAMLATQMCAVHNLQLQCAMQAKHLDHPDSVRSYTNMTTKLSNAFVQQAMLLNKLQGKGQQKVTVEHVNVEAGGQAIVGDVDNSTHVTTRGSKK